MCTFKERVDFPDGDRSQACELAETELEEEERQTDHKQHDDVGDEEGAWKQNISSDSVHYHFELLPSLHIAKLLLER